MQRIESLSSSLFEIRSANQATRQVELPSSVGFVMNLLGCCRVIQTALFSCEGFVQIGFLYFSLRKCLNNSCYGTKGRRRNMRITPVGSSTICAKSPAGGADEIREEDNFL